MKKRKIVYVEPADYFPEDIIYEVKTLFGMLFLRQFQT